MRLTLVLAILALALASCGNDGQVVQPKGGDAHMLILESEYNLGKVKDADGIVEHEFLIANDGGKAFALIAVEPHCNCTKVDFKPGVVEPGKGTKVKVKLDVRTLSPGDFVKTLDIIPSCKRDNNTIALTGTKE